MSHIYKNSFLAGMRALDMLNAEYNFMYFENKRVSEEIRIRAVYPSLKIYDFIKSENRSASQLEELKTQVKNDIIKTRALNFGLGGGAIGFVVGAFKGCKGYDFPMDGGTWFGTLIIFAVVGALIGAFVGFVTEPKITVIKDFDHWDRNY